MHGPLTRLIRGLTAGAAGAAVWLIEDSRDAACEEDACAGLGCFLGRSCSLRSTSMLHAGGLLVKRIC